MQKLLLKWHPVKNTFVPDSQRVGGVSQDMLQKRLVVYLMLLGSKAAIQTIINYNRKITVKRMMMKIKFCLYLLKSMNVFFIISEAISDKRVLSRKHRVLAES